MTEITPGPWRVAKKAARRVTNSHGVVICNAVLRNQGGPKAKSCLKDEHEAEANALLIARAPDLLAFIVKLAALRTETECDDGGDCMQCDDACSTLSTLIEDARKLERML